VASQRDGPSIVGGTKATEGCSTTESVPSQLAAVSGAACCELLSAAVQSGEPEVAVACPLINPVSPRKGVEEYDPRLHGPDPFAPRVLLSEDPFAPPAYEHLVLLNVRDPGGVTCAATAASSAAEATSLSLMNNWIGSEQAVEGMTVPVGCRSPARPTALMRRLRVEHTEPEPAAIELECSSEAEAAIIVDSSSEDAVSEPAEPLWYFSDDVASDGVGLSTYDSEPAFRCMRPDRAFRQSQKRMSPEQRSTAGPSCPFPKSEIKLPA